MDITDIISQDYVELSPDTPVSTLAGTFEDPGVAGVIVAEDAVEGVVTRRQLATSHHQPDQKLASLVWHVPRLAPDEDVRNVAQLMIDADARLLPVFEGREMVGVVTADDLLEAVQPHLEAATVAEARTGDLVTVAPDATFGQAVHRLQEERFTHLPVVEDDTAVGILSLFDVTDYTVRAVDASQGGDGGGTDAPGGGMAAGAGQSRGGFGAREGERTRLLDLPVRDLMTSPVRTIEPDATLEAAVAAMFDVGGSALVVTSGGGPTGIVTKTDALDALTWEAGGNRAVQVYGMELLDDMDRGAILEMVETFEDRDAGMSVLDAKVHLHEHTETRRGRPLLLARIRLHTDRGLYMASDEGYGASAAITGARDALERQIREDTTHGRSKKHRSEAFWEKRFGWMLEGAD